VIRLNALLEERKKMSDNYVNLLIESTSWKNKNEIRKKIPIGFENFHPELQKIYIWHIQCSINASELSRELKELEIILYKKRELYHSSMRQVQESSEKIKEFFNKKEHL
jgi:hypothetical protein